MRRSPLVKVPVLFENARSRKHEVSKPGRLRKEHFLHNKELQRFECFKNVSLVWIALGYIFSLHPQSFDFPVRRGIEHLGDG